MTNQTPETTIKNKTMKVQEEIKPTGDGARSERQELCACVPVDATLCDLHAAANCKWVSGTTSARVTEGFAALALVDTPTTNEANNE